MDLSSLFGGGAGGGGSGVGPSSSATAANVFGSQGIGGNVIALAAVALVVVVALFFSRK